MAGAASAQSDRPLTAIDWLNQETQTPFQQVNPQDLEEPVARSVVIETVTVTELADISATAAGLLPLDVANLPASFWDGQSAEAAKDLMLELPVNLLPAPRDILYRVLLAEAPANEDIVNVRLEQLMHRGAVQAAFAMMQETPPETPEGFALYFDASLLMWQITEVCQLLQQKPQLSSKSAVKIYCTARSGNWDTAVLQYFTHDTLGDIPRPLNQLLGGFLDPGLAEEIVLPPVIPQAISPLEFRLRESTGTPTPTTGLPLKFVATDLQPAAGWRSQIDAAERLASAGALPPDTLLEIYSLKKAAASGGVWERVRMMAAVQNGIDTRDIIALQSVLPALWKQAKSSNLQSVYATLLEPEFREFRFETKEAEDIRNRLTWLSPVTTDLPEELLELAEGQEVGDVISLAFSENVSPRDVTASEVLQTLTIAAAAQNGDLNALQLALLGLRSLGFETAAKRLAIEYLIKVKGL